jgi:hypothetical protein
MVGLAPVFVQVRILAVSKQSRRCCGQGRGGTDLSATRYEAILANPRRTGGEGTRRDGIGGQQAKLYADFLRKTCRQR